MLSICIKELISWRKPSLSFSINTILKEFGSYRKLTTKVPTKNIDSKLFFSEVIDVQNKYMEEALKERAQEKDEIDLPPSYSDYEDESESEKDE